MKLRRYCGMLAGPIGRDDDTLARRPGAHQLERRRRTAVGEEPSSRTEHDWIDGEHQLIDQIRAQQGLDEHAAAQNDDVLALLLSQPGDALLGAPGKQLRVHPGEWL